MGLGLLGGGVATANWFIRNGAKVAITDQKTEAELESSLKQLEKDCGKNSFVFLGEHKTEYFEKRFSDIVAVGPGVPKKNNPFLAVAKKDGVILLNDAVVFFDNLPKENPIIAITGTRGKTTATSWLAFILKKKWPEIQAAGNTPENPLLGELERLKKYPGTPAVLELSSWQLEYL